jgi:hypothetical protein
MRRTMTRDDAEAIAIRGLQFLVSDPERLGRFLTMTGLGPDNLRSAARDPSFLPHVMDFYASDDSLLIALADHLSLKPETVAMAQQMLAGPPSEFD